MSRGDIAHSNVFENLHDVTLQRLNVYHRNNGRSVYYDATHFAPTVERWNAAPVIYVETNPGEPAEHPRFEDVLAGTLPPKFRVVGNVSTAHLAEAGEPALKGAIAFTDKAIEAKAKAHTLSLSTGLASPEVPDPRLPGATRIAGQVTPNHVLVFDRGACPNCYPNDSGAMFHNLQQESDMDDESKGLLRGILDALKREPTQHVNLTEFENLKKELDAAKAQTAELANLKQEIETLKAAKATSEKDAKWGAMKTNLPAGWLGDKEAATRTEFEADPGTFALKLIAFKNTQPAATAAEGAGVAGTPGDGGDKDEVQFKNLAQDFEKKFGIRVV